MRFSQSKGGLSPAVATKSGKVETLGDLGDLYPDGCEILSRWNHGFHESMIPSLFHREHLPSDYVKIANWKMTRK